MDRYESFYLGNGWYSDGKRPQKDYYVSFGIHFYCLLYARFMEKEDPEHTALFKERAKTFSESFTYCFDLVNNRYNTNARDIDSEGKSPAEGMILPGGICLWM